MANFAAGLLDAKLLRAFGKTCPLGIMLHNSDLIYAGCPKKLSWVYI